MIHALLVGSLVIVSCATSASTKVDKIPVNEAAKTEAEGKGSVTSAEPAAAPSVVEPAPKEVETGAIEAPAEPSGQEAVAQNGAAAPQADPAAAPPATETAPADVETDAIEAPSAPTMAELAPEETSPQVEQVAETSGAPEPVKKEKSTQKVAVVDDDAMFLVGSLGKEILGVAGRTGKKLVETVGETGKVIYKATGEKGVDLALAAGQKGKEMAIAAGQKGKEMALAAGQKGKEMAIAAGEKGKEIIIKTERMIDENHDWFSGELESTVVLVDRYFDNENNRVEENQSQFKTSFSVFYEQNKDPQPGFNLDLKLVLPRFEKRVHFLFAGDSEDVNVTVGQPEGKGNPENLPKSAAIRYFLIAVDKQNLSVDGGANLKGLTPVFFGAGRYRLNVDLGEWDMRFTQWAKWFTDTGTALTTRLEFERLLNEKWLLRAAVEGNWYEQEEGYYYQGRLETYHTISPKSVLQYSATMQFQTWPENRLTNPVIRALHRRNMWREWFYIEGVLQASWPESTNYTFVGAGGLKIDLLFGRKYRNHGAGKAG